MFRDRATLSKSKVGVTVAKDTRYMRQRSVVRQPHFVRARRGVTSSSVYVLSLNGVHRTAHRPWRGLKRRSAPTAQCEARRVGRSVAMHFAWNVDFHRLVEAARFRSHHFGRLSHGPLNSGESDDCDSSDEFESAAPVPPGTPKRELHWMKTLSLPVAVEERLLRSEYRVVVTGASGWLGRASIEILARVYGKAFPERVKCFGSSAQTLRIRSGQSVDQLPLSALPATESHPTLMLHFAFLTREKIAEMSRAEYTTVNRSLSLTTAAAAGKIGVDRVFLASSGAIYQALAAQQNGREAQPYGDSKIAEEAVFEGFAHERDGRKLVIARLFNLSGPYINKLGAYALSSFIEQARQRDRACIRINAAHAVLRSYVGVENLISVVLAQLLSPDADTYDCFDTAGEHEVELQELAEMVKAIVNPEAAILRPVITSVDNDRYVGDGARYSSFAMRHGISLDDLSQQVRDTAAYLGEVA